MKRRFAFTAAVLKSTGAGGVGYSENITVFIKSSTSDNAFRVL